MIGYPKKYYKKFEHNLGATHAVSLILKLLKIKSKDYILDVGCGVGTHTYILSEYSENVIGMDPSAAGIQIARKRYPKNRFIIGSATRLPFADNIFDKAIYLQVLEHIYEQEKTASEIHRVIRPGGAAVFITLNKSTRLRKIPFVSRHLIDKTHIKEFNKNEFQKLLSKYFIIKEIRGTSMIVNFGFLNKILNILLKPDIFVYVVKR